MEFTKMHGLGNDFIVVFGEKELPADAAELAVKWCNRFSASEQMVWFIYFLPRRRIFRCVS